MTENILVICSSHQTMIPCTILPYDFCFVVKQLQDVISIATLPVMMEVDRTQYGWKVIVNIYECECKQVTTKESVKMIHTKITA